MASHGTTNFTKQSKFPQLTFHMFLSHHMKRELQRLKLFRPIGYIMRSHRSMLTKNGNSRGAGRLLLQKRHDLIWPALDAKYYLKPISRRGGVRAWV